MTPARFFTAAGLAGSSALVVAGLCAVASCSSPATTLVFDDAGTNTIDPSDPGHADAASDGNASHDAKADGKADGSASCAPHMADCDGNGSCETDLRASFQHCGACATACASGKMCAASVCTSPVDPSATTFSNASTLLADDQSAYWVGGTPVNLRAMAHGSTSYTVIAPSVPDVAFPYDQAMGLSPTDVLAVVYSATGGTVHHVPKTGGSFAVLTHDTDGSLGGNQKASIAAGGGYVFWTGGKGVNRAPIGGGVAELWTKTGCVRDLRVVSGVVYWSCYDGSVSHRLATAAPDLAFGFSAYTAGSTYAVDGTNLYYLYGTDVYAMPLGGTTGALRASSSTSYPSLLTTDGVRLYWAAQEGAGGGDAPVFAAANQPGATGEQLTAEHGQTVSIALGGTWVYFLMNGGEVYRVAK